MVGPYRYAHTMSQNGNTLTFAWEPDDRVIERANLTLAIEQRGFSGVREFHRWSITEPDAFWQFVID
jgi:hypothetical protein